MYYGTQIQADDIPDALDWQCCFHEVIHLLLAAEPGRDQKDPEELNWPAIFLYLYPDDVVNNGAQGWEKIEYALQKQIYECTDRQSFTHRIFSR